MWSKIRNYFLTGLVVFAPISITVYIIISVVDAVDDLVRALLPAVYKPEISFLFSVPGIGVLIAFLFLTALGALAANVLGRAMIRLGEKIVARMPVIRGIYTTLKQILETVMSQSSSSFREVVLIEYPRKGLWAIAFVSSDARGEIQEKTQEESLNVFLPTTPNPTSGFLLFVPKKDCIFLEMSVEQAVKYVISAGLVSPGEANPQTGRPSGARIGGKKIAARNPE